MGMAKIVQPVPAWMFTGPRTQEQGMGMSPYDPPPVAREVDYRANRHFMDDYGRSVSLLFTFTILIIFQVSQLR